MTEESRVQTFDDRKDFAQQAERLLGEVATINPELVHCMMSIVVINDPDAPDSQKLLNVAILGGDQDISSMFLKLAEVARNGIVTAATPTNPTNEVEH